MSPRPNKTSPDLKRLGPALDALYAAYDYPARIPQDPLGLVRTFTEPADQEIAGIVCAGLAYGRVSLFLPKLRQLFSWMEAEAGGPAAFVRGYDDARHGPYLAGFRYRVTAGADIARLMGALRGMLSRHGTLGDAFAAGFSPEHPDIGEALTAFVIALYGDGPKPARSFKHLLPNPAGGSACKRLNLFLRWMIRRQEGVDLGIWRHIPPSHLILPLDTHSLRMAYNLGLTHSKAMTLKNARTITKALRQLDPDDPVKYDFALCHLGMSGACPAARQDAICAECDLQGLCRWW